MKVAISCVKCKGRLWCGKSYCAVLESFKTKIKNLPRKKHFEGYSLPEVIVGWKNYPDVKVFALASEEKNLKSEEKLFGLEAKDIIMQRVSMLSGGKKWNIKKGLEEKMRELALSKKTIAVDIEFEKVLKPKLVFDSVASVMPLSGVLKKIELAEEVKIPKIVYNFAEEKIKANEAIAILYQKNFGISYISRILASGTLGVKKKLVPTRWAITATDDIIGKRLIEDIKRFKILNEILIFENFYLGNRFVILLLPKEWSFELLECWYKGSLWQNSEDEVNQDHEFFDGRKYYAENTSGAYYAARLAIAEYLCRIKRQATAIIFREIGNEYNVPLGVWLIRESIRNAFCKRCTKALNLEEALKIISQKLKTNINNWLFKSKIIDRIKRQKRITEFIKM